MAAMSVAEGGEYPDSYRDDATFKALQVTVRLFCFKEIPSKWQQCPLLRVESIPIAIGTMPLLKPCR
jgi:hypothetical protein